MSVVLRPITDRETWDAFLRDASPHSFLHSWEWGEFNTAPGQPVWRLGIYKEDSLVGVAFVFKIRARRGSFLFCPHGPVGIQIFESLHGVMRTFADYLIALGRQEKCDFIRISPLLPDTPENNELFFHLGFKEAPIHMMHPELAWILDITPPEEAILAGMRKNTRYSIRKAEKDGVEIITSNDPKDLDAFFRVYDETVSRQTFAPFSRTYFQKELKTFGDRALMFFAKYNGDTVSAAFITFTDFSAFYHHGASIHKYSKLTASHLLQWEVIREARRRGCAQYNFWGVSPQNAPGHPWAGLSLFKRGFGGTEEVYVHAKDYPLTSKYWLNWLVERARRWKRGL